MIGLVDMLPVDLLWLRDILELDVALIIRRNMKHLPKLLLRHIFEALEDGALFILTPTRKYQFLCGALVLLFRFKLLVAVSHNLMLLLLQLPPQLLQSLLVSLLINQQGAHSVYHLLLFILHSIKSLILGQEGHFIGLVRFI